MVLYVSKGMHYINNDDLPVHLIPAISLFEKL